MWRRLKGFRVWAWLRPAAPRMRRRRKASHPSSYHPRLLVVYTVLPTHAGDREPRVSTYGVNVSLLRAPRPAGKVSLRHPRGWGPSSAPVARAQLSNAAGEWAEGCGDLCSATDSNQGLGPEVVLKVIRLLLAAGEGAVQGGVLPALQAQLQRCGQWAAAAACSGALVLGALGSLPLAAQAETLTFPVAADPEVFQVQKTMVEAWCALGAVFWGGLCLAWHDNNTSPSRKCHFAGFSRKSCHDAHCAPPSPGTTAALQVDCG